MGHPSSAPKAPYCASYENGTTVKRTGSNAITWTDGLDASGLIGISLSSETGYSTDATVAYYMHHTANVCGVGGQVGETPYQIVAH